MSKWNQVKPNLGLSSSTESKRIEFHAATKPNTSHKSLYSSSVFHDKPKQKKDPDNITVDAVSGPDPGLFSPAIIISNMTWRKISRGGVGLYNQGNTCFLNATLQCLLHIPALSQVLLDEALTQSILMNLSNRSILRYYHKTVQDFWATAPGRAVSPRLLVQNIRQIGRQFRPTRQEDAHEFLRQLVDGMHEELIKARGVKPSDGRLADTDLMCRVFGGYLRNELRCPSCPYVSRTYNPFQDLSLELVGRIASLKDAVAAFVKEETLEKGNEWHCDGCKKRVRATKQLTIARPPPVLVLHLKRFAFGNGFGKIKKHIAFEERLELPCSEAGVGAGSGAHVATVSYSLLGVVVHAGDSVHSGHYVAYVKAANEQWLLMDDSSVSATSLRNVLQQQAYILFYSRSHLHTAPTKKSVPTPIPVPSGGSVDNMKTADRTGVVKPASDERPLLREEAVQVAKKVAEVQPVSVSLTTSSSTAPPANTTNATPDLNSKPELPKRSLDRAQGPVQVLHGSGVALGADATSSESDDVSDGVFPRDPPQQPKAVRLRRLVGSEVLSFKFKSRLAQLGQWAGSGFGRGTRGPLRRTRARARPEGSSAAGACVDIDDDDEDEDDDDDDEDGTSSEHRDDSESTSSVSVDVDAIVCAVGSTAQEEKGQRQHFNATSGPNHPERLVSIFTDQAGGRAGASSGSASHPNSANADVSIGAATNEGPAQILQAMVQLGKRARECDEGRWDGGGGGAALVDPAVQRRVEESRSRQQASEQAVLAGRQPSEWDKRLDIGHVKKVKPRREESVPSDASDGVGSHMSMNAFQAEQDSRQNRSRHDFFVAAKKHKRRNFKSIPVGSMK